MKTLKKTMILCLSLTILLFVSALKVNAQDNSADNSNNKRAEFGLRLMPSISTFDMNTSSGGKVSGEGTLGFGIGAILGFNFTKHVGLQGEIIYNTFSQKYKESDVERKV